MSNHTIKHILVALDASDAYITLLEAATNLASNLDVELKALFVEDINLLRLAELPFARQISYGSHTARKLTSADIEKQLASKISRMRKIVENTAKHARAKVEFKVSRGQIAHELCSAAQQVDLLVIGKNTQLFSRSQKIGKITQNIISTASCNILLLQHGTTIERPVAVLFTGSEASLRAMQLAIQLAKQDHEQLSVIYPPCSEQQYQSLTKQVNNLTKAYGFEARHIQLSDNSVQGTLQTLTDSNIRVLLLDVNDESVNQDQIQSLIQHSNIPIILIR